MNSGAFDVPGDVLAEGSTIGDHFVVRRQLGAGGMGEVYLAENLNLPGKRYAIKVLRRDLTANPGFAERLEREARTQSRLEHDNVVQIYDFFRWHQHYCLILSYIEGGTLADLIGKHPQGMPEAQAMRLMLDVLRGLNRAHEEGVLHCDVKPANVLVEANGRARVTDFGIAREVGAASERGVVVGTPEYMSPEQIETPDDVDHRTDVFSAGMMFFEMLTGRLPFDDDAAQGARFPQLVVEPTDVRVLRKDLSPELASIVMTALQRDRAARFQGCLEFERAILRYQQRRRWRRTWLPALVATCLAAVGVYLWMLKIEHDGAQQRLAAERAAQEAERQAAEAKKFAQEERVRGRKAIEASIGTALNQLAGLCREWSLLETRRKALATASEAGFQDLVAKFEKQIEDIRKNVADYVRNYNEAVRQLAAFETPLVTELINAHPQQKEAGALMRVVHEDFGARVARRPVRKAEELLAGCPR